MSVRIDRQMRRDLLGLIADLAEWDGDISEWGAYERICEALADPAAETINITNDDLEELRAILGPDSPMLALFEA